MATDRRTQRSTTASHDTTKGSGRSRATASASAAAAATGSGPLAYRVLALPPNGKVTIGHLVEEGLVLAGNRVACNSWPFQATVTAQGTLVAQWEPLPSDFVQPHGTEFMRTAFETPSAWATAVCRVMRAQGRARQAQSLGAAAHTDASPANGGDAAVPGLRGKAAQRTKSAKAMLAAAAAAAVSSSSSSAGESRVAVNGWTACRVLVPRHDPNRALAERLGAPADDAPAGGSPAASSAASSSSSSASSVSLASLQPDTIEVPLDALRQELCARISRTRAAARKQASDAADRADEETDSDDQHRPDADRTAQTELSGAVDGLARRVENGLALVCVKQRRAAAAAADAISATSSAATAAAAAAVVESQRRKKDMHSRKRKSIPDMSRHSKHSRIPSDNADSTGVDRKHSHRRPASPSDAVSSGSGSGSSSGDDGDAEISAEIAVDSVDGLDPQTRAVLAHFQSRALTLKSIHADLRTLRYQRKQQLRRSVANALDAWGRQRQRQRQRQRHRLRGGTAGARAMVEEPLADGGAPIRACVQCATTGRRLVRCGGCGDPFHWFCADGLGGSSDGSRFVCAACRVCARCLEDGPHDAAALAQCRECRRYMHTGCGSSRQQQQTAAADTDGWICDDCVECLECGLRANALSGSIEWAHDHSMCGGCARQIERARVCPECVATYSSRSSVGASMVCCDVCSFWIHTECDARLTPAVYDALITLEDAPYVCPACARSNGALLLPDIDASSASELDDDELDEAAVAAIPALPRCLRASISQKQQQQQHTAMAADSDSETETESEAETQTTDAAIATLLASQATLASPVAPDADTAAAAEAANLLLSLTRSDVRFDRSRFDIEALESRYCAALPASLTGPPVRDWRRCALCGLCGDGVAAPERLAQRPSLGRLVPLLGAAAAASRWAHVECVAWAWGPVATSAAELPPPSVRFQGALLLDSKDRVAGALPCTLCGRPGASFHCCAPVACFDTAYHLPCLLLAGTPTPTPAHPQFCAAWRRALCASHAPEFAAMMPADHDVRGTPYDCVRVTAAIDNMPLPHNPAQSPPAPVSAVSDSHCAARIGNLFVLAWAPAPADPLGAGFHCLRFIDLPGFAPHTLALRCAAPDVWSGGSVAGFPAARHALSLALPVSAPSLSALLRALLARITVPAPASSLLLAATVDIAVRYPLRFLGLCGLRLSASSLAPPVSASPLPRPAAATPGIHIATHHSC
ncbi:hypothetical protein LPJ72_004019 [Coemansia sp. Benny D160-2]|nr:hypothetical protein LPJ72_004019 [Coemansia sp. Benny D160-2]